MVPAHFQDVDGDLSDHNVGKILGLSKILTVILCFARSLLMCFVLGSLAALIHLQVVQEL